MSVTCELGAVSVQSDWLNSALSPVVYGDIALSINTQYNITQVYIYYNILYNITRPSASENRCKLYPP